MAGAVRIVPLGGIGEIGKNITVFEDDDQIVLIDCGITFPRDDESFGADIILPDFEYLARNRDKLRALVLTHGHEDHIGAVPHLLREIAVPQILGTRFTLALVKAKADEAGLIGATEWVEVAPEDDPISIGDFEFEFLRVSHSIPDCVSVAIHTQHGTIVHTGDLKLDPSPLDGKQTDLAGFAALGERGVALYLGDSTNADVPGHTLSERSVGGPLRDIVAGAPGRVIVSCFSSHIHRIQQLVDIAREHRRTVCILGRSMNRNVNIARNLGYLDAEGVDLIKPNAIQDYRPRDLLVICTGSQGERLAVLNRIAKGIHPQIAVTSVDTVVFSSRTIPGNEVRVHSMIDQMSRAGAHILHGETAPVHVSGHGAAEELQTMLQLVRPRHFMPVHGEWRHLRAHGDLARAVGVADDRIIVGENGSVVELRDGRAKLTGEFVPVGANMVDRSTDEKLDPEVVDERRRASSDGMLLVVVQFADDGSSTVSVTAKAMAHVDEELLEDALDAAEAALDEAEGTRWTPDELERMLAEAVDGAVSNGDRFAPLVVPVIVGA